MKPLAALVLLAMLLPLAGCRSKERADQAVAEFHRRYNAGEYAEIYQNTAKAFTDDTTGEQLTTLLAGIERQFGKVRDSRTTSVNINSVNGATDVTLGALTTYDRGRAYETFSFMITGTRAVLVNYGFKTEIPGAP